MLGYSWRDRRPVAYVVPDSTDNTGGEDGAGGGGLAAVVRGFAAARLPGYMVPVR
jgi:hypothetical protein